MQTGFDELKKLLAKAITLAHPDPNAELFITTDTSDTAVGGILSRQTVGDRSSPFGSSQKSLTTLRESIWPSTEDCWRCMKLSNTSSLKLREGNSIS